MGIGPAPAIRKALERAGLSLGQLDLVEINEAFAPQYLAWRRSWASIRERTNVNGGAIALGHPLGASGARLLLTLALELRRRKKTYGLASACIGGGQGIAMIIERFVGSRGPGHGELGQIRAMKTVGVLGLWADGRGDRAGLRRRPGFEHRRARGERGRAGEGAGAHRQVPRGRRGQGQDDRRAPRPRCSAGSAARRYADLAGCDLVIEAIVENVEAKRQAYAQVEAVVGPDCLLASNTSSLCITEMAAAPSGPTSSAGCTSSTRCR